MHVSLHEYLYTLRLPVEVRGGHQTWGVAGAYGLPNLGDGNWTYIFFKNTEPSFKPQFIGILNSQHCFVLFFHFILFCSVLDVIVISQ